MCIVETHVNNDAAHGRFLNGKHLNDRLSRLRSTETADKQVVPGTITDDASSSHGLSHR
jgi:hypothetical protein